MVGVKVDADISEALEQIYKKGYFGKYKPQEDIGARTASKKLYALGITFSTTERTVRDIALETAEP